MTDEENDQYKLERNKHKWQKLIQLLYASLILGGVLFIFSLYKYKNPLTDPKLNIVITQLLRLVYSILIAPLLLITLAVDFIYVIFQLVMRRRPTMLPFTSALFTQAPNRNDWIVIFLNVIFFAIVQTLFFKYIASKQYENVLESKLDWLRTLTKENEEVKKKVQEIKSQTVDRMKDISEYQKKRRERLNAKLEFRYCWSYAIAIGVILLGLTIYSIYGNLNKSHEFTLADGCNIAFVLLAYCTELFFFFFIVRKYEFVGDNYILTNIMQNMVKSTCAQQ